MTSDKDKKPEPHDSPSKADSKDEKARMSGRQPISAAVRARLQNAYKYAGEVASRGQLDYATELYGNCLREDPGNVTYVQAYLNNLYRKYNNNKKGSKMAALAGMGAQGNVKKCQLAKDWPGVLKAGLDMLKHNPWHVGTLLAMGAAAENLGFDDVQLIWLKGALDVDLKDITVNKACAQALGRQGQFDQAIACWHRVEQVRPGDEEAQRAISALSVERTISATIHEELAAEQAVEEDAAKAAAGGVSQGLMSVEQMIREAIAKNPAEVKNYVELSDLISREGKLEEAEQLLSKALEVSGGDLKVREMLEDAQVRRARQQLELAEKQAREKKTQKFIDLYKKMKLELTNLEISIFRARTERYPTSANFKYELGIRLKKVGNYDEAIRTFQAARNDPKRKGIVLLELGECFQGIKQYALALKNYEDAIDNLTEREEEQRKLALYRAGKLAKGLKEVDKAKKHLTELAGLDFSYKDVGDLLKELRG